jgi:hypothetical protein
MRRTAQAVVIFSVIAVLAGCADRPPVKIQNASTIKRIGLVITPVEEKLSVLDHTGVWEAPEVMGQFGAVGMLAEGLVRVVEQKSAAHGSLGGGIEELYDVLPVYPLQGLEAQKITDRLSTRYEVVNLGLPGKGLQIEDYLTTAKQHGLDTLLKVDLAYGLAVYAGAQASAAIDAQVYVYDVRNGNVVLNKLIRSDQFVRSGNTVGQFKANGAELFKRDIVEAADGLAILIASEFGFEQPEARNGLFETRYVGISCSEPYLLEQDCNSITGPTRKVELNGYKMKTAGSRDGKALMIALCTCREKVVDREGVETVTDGGVEITKCYAALKDELGRNNINIRRTTHFLVQALFMSEGYMLEMDGDGYSILKGYSVMGD